MSVLKKVIACTLAAACITTVVVTPAKADPASDALKANQIWLQQIAEQTVAAAKARDDAAAYGLKMAQARQDEIQAAADAGLGRAQANIDAAIANQAVAKSAVDAAADYGMKMAQARQAEIQAAANAGITSGNALLEQIAAQTQASAAAIQAAANAGL